MTNENTHVRINEKLYAIDSLSKEARDVLLAINENQQMLLLAEAQHRQFGLAKATLTNALGELVADVEPVDEAPLEQSEVTLTED